MRKAVFLILVLLIGGVVAYAFLRTAADGSATLAQSIAAHGGAAAIERARTGTIAAHGQVADRMGLKFPVTIEESFQTPNLYKRLISTQDWDGKKLTIGILAPDGKRWRRAESGSVEVVSADTAEEQGLLNFLQELLRIRERKVPLTSIPTEDVLGRPALGFEPIASESTEPSLYFDRETKLCVKVKRKLIDAADKKGVLELILSNYRDIDGVQVPMKVTTLIDGKLYQDVQLDKVQFLERLPEDTFRAPPTAP
jgi:hypothetical protein